MVTVRQIEAGDINRLSALARKTYTEAFGPSLSEADLETQLEKARSVAYFSRVFKQDTFLGAFHEDNLIGYIQLCDVTLPVKTATAKDQQLNALYIHSDFQGQGIGKLLMETALMHPRFKNAGNIYTDVWDQNVRACGLYKRYGFKEIGKCEVVIDTRIIGYDLVLVRPSRAE